MSAQQVFNELLFYYQATGEVMKEDMFATAIASEYRFLDVLEGIRIFDSYLDSKRKEAG